MKNDKTTEIYSDIPEIQSVIADRMTEINRAGIFVSLKQKLNYGVQLLIEGQNGNGLINFYYSKKRGLSFVGSPENNVSRKVINILKGIDGEACPESENGDIKESGFKKWIGTDESGKGDFFGPLVVSGFLMTREMERGLLSIGVADCKKLTSNKVGMVARVLLKEYKSHISVIAPYNSKYNELYEKFKNLNRFLAWGHARAIQNLVKEWSVDKNTEIDGVVADQFGDEEYIKNALTSMKKINLIQRPGGESNTAVAAASIVARYLFEKRVKALEKEYNFAFPFGAGSQVVAAAREFKRKFGKEKLRDVAKIHFKTYREL